MMSMQTVSELTAHVQEMLNITLIYNSRLWLQLEANPSILTAPHTPHTESTNTRRCNTVLQLKMHLSAAATFDEGAHARAATPQLHSTNVSCGTTLHSWWWLISPYTYIHHVVQHCRTMIMVQSAKQLHNCTALRTRHSVTAQPPPLLGWLRQ